MVNKICKYKGSCKYQEIGEKNGKIRSIWKAKWDSPAGQRAKARQSKILKDLWASKAGLKARKLMSESLRQFHRETSHIV